jgi:hypothetical protein
VRANSFLGARRYRFPFRCRSRWFKSTKPKRDAAQNTRCTARPRRRPDGRTGCARQAAYPSAARTGRTGFGGHARAVGGLIVHHLRQALHRQQPYAVSPCRRRTGRRSALPNLWRGSQAAHRGAVVALGIGVIPVGLGEQVLRAAVALAVLQVYGGNACRVIQYGRIVGRVDGERGEYVSVYSGSRSRP